MSYLHKEMKLDEPKHIIEKREGKSNKINKTAKEVNLILKRDNM